MLGVSSEEAEKLASTMITQDRLAGTIDQMKQLLYFKAGTCNISFSALLHSSPFSFSENANTIEDWDSHIEHVCSSVNALIDQISAKHPQWIAANVK